MVKNTCYAHKKWEASCGIADFKKKNIWEPKYLKVGSRIELEGSCD